MAQNRTNFVQEAFVGLFMAAVLALLIFFTVVISGMDLLTGKSRVKRLVTFENVGGLRPQDPVLVRGMPVGKVQHMALNEGKVEVTILIDEKVCFLDGYEISVKNTSVLGGSQLVIKEGKGSALGEDSVLVGKPVTDWMEDLGGLVGELRGAVSGDDLQSTMKNLSRATASIANLAARVEKGEGSLGRLFSADARLYNDLESTVASLRTVAGRLENGEGTLGKLMKEDRLYLDLSATLASVKTVAARLEDGRGTIGKLMGEDETVYNDLAEAVKNIRSVTGKIDAGEGMLGKLIAGGGDSTLMGDLEASAKSLRVVLGRLENGEGTLGHLSKDDAIAVEVEGAIKDVRQIIDNMRDTAPITTFTSLFFSGL